MVIYQYLDILQMLQWAFGILFSIFSIIIAKYSILQVVPDKDELLKQYNDLTASSTGYWVLLAFHHNSKNWWLKWGELISFKPGYSHVKCILNWKLDNKWLGCFCPLF